MMELLHIKQNEMKPEIKLEPKGSLYFGGRSMMEDASTFYAQIHGWLRTYLDSGAESIEVSCDLTYFNSSSAKQLLKVLMTIDDAEIEAKVIWYYPKENDVLYDRGAELAIMVDLPFEYVAK
jgi:ABC-type xylose transport system substrate-binding protein